MHNLSKISFDNKNLDINKVDKVFKEQGVVVIKGFFEKSLIENIASSILNLISKIENGNQIPNNSIEIIYSSSSKFSYQEKINSEKTILEFRDKEDYGMIDIFNFDKSFEEGQILKKKILDEKLKSVIEKSLKKKVEFENFNIYYNKGIVKTRGYHIDSYNNRFKLFMYLTNCEDIDNGPFSFILKSHNAFFFRTISRIYNKIFKKRNTDMHIYNKLNETKIYGKSGTLFLSNQKGFHRGWPQSKNGKRLVAVLNLKIN